MGRRGESLEEFLHVFVDHAVVRQLAAPVGKLPTSDDTSYAYTLGGGVDIAVSKHVWIRAVQADYFYSELRNLQGNRQNQVRLGAGVLFRGGRK